MKAVFVAVLVLIVAALGSAGVFMLRRGRGEPDGRMARALAWRIGLSIALFLSLLVAWKLGWIEPRGLPAGR